MIQLQDCQMKILLITMKEADKDLRFHIESEDFIPFL